MTGHSIDAIAISIIVLVNAGISFSQEWKAEKSLASLKEMAAPTSLALRGEEWISVPSRDLVPGDIVKLNTGDIVGADVRRRTHEIGVRLALGADTRDVFRRVIGRGATLGALGIGLGVMVAVAATRALDKLVYGVALMDPTTLAVVSGILMAVTVAACYVPARRATRIDPIRTLRAD